ncbi:MAG: GNAT family N-acetyltransferase [Methanobrevibacter millerae]|uniref:GNAT family N-acetyltransferase n=1 Tax=Methanobrevibacter millerae TaxID=230361 RepID=A0A8T3VIQ2_9EURY|nr:GNAT family N-acetyltransferase [Methanobrevibacter millerae]MBE6505173.1 GNAT family N-acetyltransferase [Methanobrevibacter millerae]
MKICKATEDDLPEILALQYLAFQSEVKLFKNKKDLPLKQTLDELTDELNKGVILKLILDDDTIIGSVRAYTKDGTTHIGKLMVHPDYRKRGLGTGLMEKIENCFLNTRYELFTASKSVNNIEFYKKRGYEIFAKKRINEELVLIYMQKPAK